MIYLWNKGFVGWMLMTGRKCKCDYYTGYSWFLRKCNNCGGKVGGK